jgi:predicted CopG family antitoxin
MASSVTTVALDENARQLFGQLRDRYKAKSFSDLVRILFRKERDVPQSMFGADRDMPDWLEVKKEIRGGDRADKWDLGKD